MAAFDPARRPGWLIAYYATFAATLGAVALFCASALTEVSQYYWPRGLFSGRFDPADIAAYAVALAACDAAERRWPVDPAPLVER